MLTSYDCHRTSSTQPSDYLLTARRACLIAGSGIGYYVGIGSRMVSRNFRLKSRSVESMRKFFGSFVFLIAMNVCASGNRCRAWLANRSKHECQRQPACGCNAARHRNYSPHQKYKIYSAAPNWSVVYINNQIGTYLEFPHEQFMGSIIGPARQSPGQ